jgi:hypothetical protein
MSKLELDGDGCAGALAFLLVWTIPFLYVSFSLPGLVRLHLPELSTMYADTIVAWMFAAR